MKLNKVDKLFVVYRLVFMLIAVYGISRLTVLGDYERYSTAVFGESFMNLMKVRSDAALTDTLISGLRFLFFGQIIFVNILLNILSSLCLLRLIKKMKYQVILFILILSPSFNVWSSFASKEIIIVSAMAIMLTEIISFLKEDKVHYVIGFIAVALLMFYKLQFILPIIQLLMSVFLLKKFSNKHNRIIIPLILVVNILGIFVLRDNVEELVRSIIVHFSTTSRSTRDSAFLMEDYGFFKALPFGMFITFFGPTLSEISVSYLHLFTAVESTVIISVLLYLVVRKDKKMIKPNFVNIIVVVNLMLLLMFFQTPWGILNPGSAIRYRADYFLYILVLFYLYRENFFLPISSDDNE